MNTNLQIAIANDHRLELRRQAAKAQLVAEVRARRSERPAPTAHSQWLRARHLLAGAMHVSGLTHPHHSPGFVRHRGAGERPWRSLIRSALVT